MKNGLFDSRFWIGFSDLLALNEKVIADNYDTFPKYNVIAVGDTQSVIELAVAGYKKQDLSVILDGNYLKISGSIETKSEPKFAYKGISARTFQRSFVLEEDTEVKDIFLEDGILSINLETKTPKASGAKKLEIK